MIKNTTIKNVASIVRWLTCMACIFLVLGFRTLPLLSNSSDSALQLSFAHHDHSSESYESAAVNVFLMCADDDCHVDFSFRSLRCCGIVVQNQLLSGSTCLLDYVHPLRGYFLCFSDSSPPIS